MKFWQIIFFTTAIYGCSPDDSQPFIQRVSSIEMFDVGNAGNASDIRVRIKLESIAGVDELRIIVVPATEIDELTSNQAIRLSADQYFSVPVITTEQTYSERLDEVLDINGDRVVENSDYAVAIFVLGDRLTQLSTVQSNTISLTENAIYAGTYEGTTCCIPSPGISGALSDEDEFISMAITGNGIQYQGMMETPVSNAGIIYTARIEFMVENSEITYFRFFDPNPIDNNGLSRFRCSSSEAEMGIEGIATMVRDLTLSVEFPRCESLALQDKERYIIARRVLEEE